MGLRMSRITLAAAMLGGVAIGAGLTYLRQHRGRQDKALEPASIPDHARRMYDEALAYLHDSDRLAQLWPPAESNAQQHLRVLSFEILLKCAVYLSGARPQKDHDYARHWRQLPHDAQDEIMTTARARMPGHADLSNLRSLFKTWRRFFERGRYYYETQMRYTAEQQHKRGEGWIKRGAPENESDARSSPMELDCMIEGLRAFVEARLKS